MLTKITYYNLKSIKIVGITGLAILFFLAGCKQPAKHIKQFDGHLKIDTASLIHQYDSLYWLAYRTKQYKHLYTATEIFNNTEVAKQYPDLVRDMYTNALILLPVSGIVTDSINLALKIIKNFENLANEIESKKLKIWTQYFYARYFGTKGEIEIALPKYLNIYKSFEAQKDTYGMSLITKRIGIIYAENYHDYPKSIYYSLQALKLTSDSNEVAVNSFQLVKSYLQINQPDSARIYLRYISYINMRLEAEPLYQIYQYANSNKGNIDSINNCIARYINQDVFFEMGFFNKVLIKLYAKYAMALMKHKQYQLAHLAIDKGLKRDSLCSVCEEERVELYKARYLYFQEIKSYDQAFYYLEKYNDAATALNSEKRKASIETAKVKYEFDQEQVKQKQKQMQSRFADQQIIHKQKMVRNIIIAVSILLLIIAALLLNYYRLNKKLEMEKMRSRISRDLHDDIGSTLSSINIISGMAHTQTVSNSDEKSQAALEKINERSQRLLDDMSDIIWSVKPENDTLEETFSRMRLYATSVLEAKGILYTLDFPVKNTTNKLLPEVKNNLYLIFKEAVNNLAKYSNCKHAHLSISIKSKQLSMLIRDNGVGFNTDFQNGEMKSIIQNFGGSGLKNMQARANDINANLKIESELGKGTLIALTFNIV